MALHPELQSYRDGFFEKFLVDLPGPPTVATLEQQQPAGQPLVVLGEYIEYTGGPITPVPNGSITPQFAIRTEIDGQTRTFVMLWVVERFDVATDTRETIARILADFRSPTVSGTAETPEASVASELAGRWADALTTAAVRQALAHNLSEITAVPAGLPTSDLEDLRAFLRHFGTYKADGTYYAKGTIAEGAFPAGASAAYLAADTGNLAEIRLQRDLFYCYALVSERLWSPQGSATRARQLVYRVEDRGTEAAERWRLALLHTVGANQAEAVVSRFIIFHAAVGLGVALPDSAVTSVAPSTATLLESLPVLMADLPSALSDESTPLVGSPDSPYLLLMGAVLEGFPRTPLPEGVIEDGEGAVRAFRCPPQQLRALAERPDIENLVASTPVWPYMQHAMSEINLAGRTFPAGVTAATTGQGVLIGIVDSGIDGGHPAFLGRQDDATKSRIHSVWNIWESGGSSPFARSSSNAAYRSMNFGREYIGHDEVVTVRDPDTQTGHGTHVSGIAAGRPVGTWPGGIAPAATLVVVSVGSSADFVNDVLIAVKYCFQKATELGMACVVNISLGTERHSHDGTDPLSIGLTQLVSQNNIPATGIGILPSSMPNYIDGRIIVAAAGNLRNSRTHWQASISPGGTVSLLYQPRFVPSNGNADGITFWAFNEDATSVRLRISTRHSSNAVLAVGEVSLMRSNGRVTGPPLAGGHRVNIHNGPPAPNNRHYNPEVYWIESATAVMPAGPWIVQLRNDGRANCVVHGFCAFREHAGAFVFNPAQTQPLIAVTYTNDQLRQFESHKVGTPATAPGCICVAAFTSEPGLAGSPVDDIAGFSSPGPLRAAGPGRRAIDVAMPGHRIVSARSAGVDPSRGVYPLSGTSMASPVMTGLVAAKLQINRNLDTGDLRNEIEVAASRRPADTVDDWGLGRIDAVRFLRP